MGVDPRMRYDPDERGHHLGRNPICHLSVNHAVQPIPKFGMCRRFRPERIDQYTDIRQDHFRPSRTSSNAELSFRSIPGRTPPPARQTGRTTRFRFAGRDWARTSRSPCSISAVSVSCRRAASDLACSRMASSSRTVVLICLDIPMRSRYVKGIIPSPDPRI
jgi:hypothetical protein